MATCARSLGLQHLAKTRYTEAVGSVEAFAVAADAGVLNHESSARHIKRALGKRGSRVILSCATGIVFKLELDMHVLCGAAASGDFEWLKLVGELMQESQPLTRAELINAAVSAAHSGDDGDMLDWILEQDWGEGGMPQWIGAGLATVAATHGHARTVRWLFDVGPDNLRLNLPAYAEHYNDIDLDDIEEVALRNCFEVDPRSAEACVYSLLDTAVKAGHEWCVHNLINRYVEHAVSAPTVALAVEHGHVGVAKLLLQYLHTVESKSAVVASLAAVRGADAALFKWARQRGMGEWSPETLSDMLAAAGRVRNKPLKTWLRSLQAEN
eukprot:TRINITY_DN15079_c0_g1_i1.p1 TRINITY_DN15079_c0_g1~~TRINITY_DN15079_c0_g1_i1.p1  ORF type:complete len:326 (-),score=77.63 TRINITY_DN15079_c0_g1_i1:78-1055(-)